MPKHMQQFSETVIIGNGAFPKHSVPLQILRNAKRILCCDGAADDLVANGFEPFLVIGDMDSISDVNKNRFSHIVVEDPDQDTNDQTKAINWLVKHGFTDTVILGSTGKREDHSIGNIALLCDYAKKIKVCAVSNYGIFTPILQSQSFDSFAGQQVSVFSLLPSIKISSSNLKYPLNQMELKSWWMGTLNESQGESFTIHFSNGELIVFQSF
jgi:thiamine pyrophosphokinase